VEANNTGGQASRWAVAPSDDDDDDDDDDIAEDGNRLLYNASIILNIFACLTYQTTDNITEKLRLYFT
jgi:hypothetical protein